MKVKFKNKYISCVLKHPAPRPPPPTLAPPMEAPLLRMGSVTKVAPLPSRPPQPVAQAGGGGEVEHKHSHPPERPPQPANRVGGEAEPKTESTAHKKKGRLLQDREKIRIMTLFAGN